MHDFYKKMRYTEVQFRYNFAEDYMLDLFQQQLADTGFESFSEDKAYIQSSLYDAAEVARIAAEAGQIIAGVRVCADENWNEVWEAEHGQVQLPYGIRITPHGAFGAGDHTTTAMMLNAIAREGERMRGARVLDMGCGSGVLGIMAAKQGAGHVTSIDIDERAVRSTEDNAAKNGVLLHAVQGDSVPEGIFDYIFANIHRNILLAMLPDFGKRLSKGGKVMMSGFYEEDVAPLEAKAREAGLTLCRIDSDGEWRMITTAK